jgi:Lrp/AsnC family transcriptional regulator, leucine-responsive regulatory protein
MVAAVGRVGSTDTFIVMLDASSHPLNGFLLWESHQVPGPHAQVSTMGPHGLRQGTSLELIDEINEALLVLKEIVIHKANNPSNRLTALTNLSNQSNISQFMLGALDSKVVRLLMQNGRATWAELANHLGLSAPAAADRVHRLEERGVIRGYAALVDAEAAGYPLAAFVAVALDRPDRRAAFLKRIAALPEVAECHHVAGDDDYLLKVRCRGTRDLDRLLVESLKTIPGVRTRTTVVLATTKESVLVPVAEAD